MMCGVAWKAELGYIASLRLPTHDSIPESSQKKSDPIFSHGECSILIAA